MTLYETEADRDNERAVVKMICQRLGWTHFEKLPLLNPLDWKIYYNDGVTLRGYLMVKCRHWSYGRGDGYRISLTKVAAADNMRTTRGFGTRLAVRFDDKLDEIWWTVLRGPYRTIFAGRDDRPHDPKAKEDHAVIEWADFAPVTVSST